MRKIFTKEQYHFIRTMPITCKMNPGLLPRSIRLRPHNNKLVSSRRGKAIRLAQQLLQRAIHRMRRRLQQRTQCSHRAAGEVRQTLRKTSRRIGGIHAAQIIEDALAEATETGVVLQDGLMWRECCWLRRGWTRCPNRGDGVREKVGVEEICWLPRTKMMAWRAWSVRWGKCTVRHRSSSLPRGEKTCS